MNGTVAECTNVITGEVLDLAQMSDEEIVEQLESLEAAKQVAFRTLEAAKGELMNRMEREGARLRLTSKAKLRLHYQSRIRDRKLVEKLYEECPEELKGKCFRFDIRPLKSGLNELAKLGNGWQEKMDVLYEQVATLKIEWQQPVDEEAAETQAAAVTDGKQDEEVPF